MKQNFYEAELKFSLLCPCASCSKHNVPGSSFASGASGHLWSCALFPSKTQWPLPCDFQVPCGYEPCRLLALLRRLQWPQDSSWVRKVWEHKLPERNILADMRAITFALCPADKQHWVNSLVLLWPQVKAYWKAFLLHPNSIWLRLLLGRTIRGTRACREPQHCMSALAEPGRARVVPLWCCEGWLRFEKTRLRFCGQSAFFILASRSSSGLQSVSVCPGDTAHYCRELGSPFSAGLYKWMFRFLCLEIRICVPSYLGG